MGVLRIGGVGGQNIYTKQPTSTQVTLLNSKLQNIKCNAGDYVYLNYESSLVLDAGGTQTIPAFESYTNISQIIALGKGTLKSSGSIPKLYVGNIVKREVTY